ncbi:MAG: M48 family metalloprotease [Candidatus Rokubacteria bacterium]|nr:M48 family metalloprotease [Candidatus Rokubacteria bacterium]
MPDADSGERAPYLGLLADEATDTLADAVGVAKRDGVLVLGVVPGGPAERAGIQAGDYLEKIGPQVITISQDLVARAELDVTGPMPVRVRRGEALVETPLELEYLPWNVEFKVAEDDAVNASSAPGTITITTGMLRFLRSDAELAVVVSHELAHITRRHDVGKLGLALPTVVVGIAAALIVPGSQRLVSTVVEKVIANVVRGALTKVDWDMEREADVFGLLYLHAAGYDPGVASDLWERFAVELPAARSFSFISDHPPSSERLIRLNKLVEALRSGVSPDAILAGNIDDVPLP